MAKGRMVYVKTRARIIAAGLGLEGNRVEAGETIEVPVDFYDRYSDVLEPVPDILVRTIKKVAADAPSETI